MTNCIHESSVVVLKFRESVSRESHDLICDRRLRSSSIIYQLQTLLPSSVGRQPSQTRENIQVPDLNTDILGTNLNKSFTRTLFVNNDCN